MLNKMDKKEPISDLTAHNIKREEEVRSATKRLDEYLVEKYDLNRPGDKVLTDKGTKLSNEKNSEESKTTQNMQKDSGAENKSDKKSN